MSLSTWNYHYFYIVYSSYVFQPFFGKLLTDFKMFTARTTNPRNLFQKSFVLWWVQKAILLLNIRKKIFTCKTDVGFWYYFKEMIVQIDTRLKSPSWTVTACNCKKTMLESNEIDYNVLNVIPTSFGNPENNHLV